MYVLVLILKLVIAAIISYIHTFKYIHISLVPIHSHYVHFVQSFSSSSLTYTEQFGNKKISLKRL